MNIAELLAKRARDSQVPQFAEYPKWIKADGKDMIVNSAEEEQEALGTSSLSDETGEGESETVSNLLSEPKKKRGCPPGGWPKKDSTSSAEG